MPLNVLTVKQIFLAALEKAAGPERQGYVDEACAGDSALRRRVDAMLQSHAASGSLPDFLAMEANDRGLTEDVTPPSQAATLPPPGQPAVDSDDSVLPFFAPPREPGHLGRLEHYEILLKIGQGGMGVVFKAQDESLDRIVAIKLLLSQFAASATARRRFVREAKAIAAVVHEHVVTVHAVADNAPVPYLVMQYIQGVSLQDRLERTGPLEEKEILRIGMQAARGLAAAHAQGIVHRDIKPANILLENGIERVKITDFGLARAVDDASITQSGVIAGTPMYMSPEQANSEPVDPRSDLFSLGSVLYALCTGHPPFRADSTLTVLMRVASDTPRPVRELNPDIPDWLEAIIAKLHAKKREDRFQNAEEVADLLEQHLAHIQQPHLTSRPRPVVVASTPPAKAAPIIEEVQPVAPARWRWRRLIWTGLAYALLLFVLFALIGTNSEAGWWATPWIEFLSAPAFLGLAAWHFRRGPRWLAVVPVLLAVLLVLMGIAIWPYSTGKYFRRLVREGRFDEASRMLHPASGPWTYTIRELTIRDKTGASVKLDYRDLPLLSYDGSWDHFVGQEDVTANRFTLTSHRVNSCFCNITVTAYYGSVICDAIHRYAVDSNNVAQVLSPFQWAERRGEASPPATKPPSGPIDLLALTAPDRKKDARDGTWKKDQGKLVCEPGPTASRAGTTLLSAPDEYDLEAVIERTAGDHAILFGMKTQGKLFHVGLDVAESDGPARWSGLGSLNGRSVADSQNPTRTRGPHLINGKKYTLRCQVRAAGIAATLDDQPLFNYQGGYDKIHGSKDDAAEAFFVWAHGATRYVVHRWFLTPNSPQGEFGVSSFSKN